MNKKAMILSVLHTFIVSSTLVFYLGSIYYYLLMFFPIFIYLVSIIRRVKK